MKDNKHIKSFNEHQENLNISDVSSSKNIKMKTTLQEFLNENNDIPRFLTKDDYINVDNLDESLKGDWSVFIISNGKYYISSIYKENLKHNEAKSVNLSDASILKMTKDFATKVALVNKERFQKAIGVVNSKGLQIIL